MVEQRVISAEEAREAGEEGLRFASSPFPIQAPHFVMYVQGLLESLLPAERIAQGGLRVVTDARPGLAAGRRGGRRPAAGPTAAVRGRSQNALAGVNCDANADPSRRVENAALVALDPATGAIRTMVGSPDYFDGARSGAMNAALAERQPGSAIKPLTYALALDPAGRGQNGACALDARDNHPRYPHLISNGRRHALRAEQLRPALSRAGHGPHRSGQQLQHPGYLMEAARDQVSATVGGRDSNDFEATSNGDATRYEGRGRRSSGDRQVPRLDGRNRNPCRQRQADPVSAQCARHRSHPGGL